MAGRKPNLLKYLYLTLTQGSADAFVQSSLTTGLLNLTKTCYLVREIMYEFGAAGGAATNGGIIAGGGMDITLTRKSLSASPNLSDHSVLWKHKQYNALTTSGAVKTIQAHRETFNEEAPLVIVEDPIYGQLDSNGTSLSNVVYIRIGYEERSVSEVERLAFVAASLAS